MDKRKSDEIFNAIQDAIKAIERQYGVKCEKYRGRYNSANLDLSISFREMDEETGQRAITSGEKARIFWELTSSDADSEVRRAANEVGAEGVIGLKFKVYGENRIFKIVGYNSKKRKYCLMIQAIDNHTIQYNCTAGSLKYVGRD